MSDVEVFWLMVVASLAVVFLLASVVLAGTKVADRLFLIGVACGSVFVVYTMARSLLILANRAYG